MAFERGVILGPKFSRFERHGNVGYTIETHADPTLLRHAILYFDKIHWAQNAYMMGGIPEEIHVLHEAGIADARITQLTEDGPRVVDEPWVETARRGGTYPSPMPADMAAAYFKAQAETFRALDKAEPEVWTMGGHAPMWEAPGSVADKRLVTEIKINAALPTPPDDVHIADVIDFRDRYKAQFIEFRVAIDEIHARIESSTTPLRAEANAIERLNAAIAEVRAVANASWWQGLQSAVKINRTLSLREIGLLAVGIIGPLEVGQPLAIPLSAFAIAAGKVSIDFKELLAPRGLPDGNKSYAYLLSLASEFDLKE